MVSAKGLHVVPRHECRMFKTVMSHETPPRKLGVPPRAGENRLETKQHWNGTSTNITQVARKVWHMTSFPGTIVLKMHITANWVKGIHPSKPFGLLVLDSSRGFVRNLPQPNPCNNKPSLSCHIAHV
jgi:hypothetical protein